MNTPGINEITIDIVAINKLDFKLFDRLAVIILKSS